MAWIRLSDDYNDHPKFDHLSDGAFRLWHQGMGFCRKYQTDGLIPLRTIREFKAYRPKRMRELLTPWKDTENPLWHDVPGFGVTVHDYLGWNPSKGEENERRADSKERMRQLREDRRTSERRSPTRPQPVTVRANIPRTNAERSQNVPGWEGKKELQEKDVLPDRAARFLERYPQIFAEERDGAHYHVREARDFQTALELVTGWADDARLDDMFRVFLHLKGKDVLNQPGTPGQFLHHAPECDQLLRANGR